MSETIDPLQFLRDHVSRGQPVNFVEDKFLEIGGLRLPFDVKTAYKQKGKEAYYTIGQLYMCVKCKDAKVKTEYMRESGRLGIPMVLMTEVKDVLAYMLGENNLNSQIDPSMIAQTLIRKSDLRSGKMVSQGQHMRPRDKKGHEKDEDQFHQQNSDTIKAEKQHHQGQKGGLEESKQPQNSLKEEDVPLQELEVCDYIQMNEKKIHSRSTAMQCQKRSFLKVLKLGYQVVKMYEHADAVSKRIEQRGPIAKDVTLDVSHMMVNAVASASGSTQQNQARSILEDIMRNKKSDKFDSSMHPIIVVPPSLQPGSLCLGNIAQFLEKGAYTEDKTDRPQPVQVKKKICGREITFDVYDSVAGFSDTRWTRIVAVIVSGEEWQFKDWKQVMENSSKIAEVPTQRDRHGREIPDNKRNSSDKNGKDNAVQQIDKKELFARVRGYFFSFTDAKPPVVVANWNVLRCPLPRYKRHHDVNEQNHFWQDMEQFLKREKFKGSAW